LSLGLVALLNVNALHSCFLSLHVQLMIDIIVDAEFPVELKRSRSGVPRELVGLVLVDHI